MLLNDPVTLLCILTPFGLMTALVLCLSYIGLGKSTLALRWWLIGDLVLALYRVIPLLQPGLFADAPPWLELLSPATTFISNIAVLLIAIGGHTLALHHLNEKVGNAGSQARLLLLPSLFFALGGMVLISTVWILPWFLFWVLVSIALQVRVTRALARHYRGAWGLLAGQLALLAFHGYNLLAMLVDLPPVLAFDEPDLPSLMALIMDFMVSFLFTLAFALMLQEQLRLHMQQLSITDSLTGALNRRGALAVLDREWQLAAQQHYPIAVAMLDLDNFKHINDRFGHSVGDQALQSFSSAVGDLKRQSDVFVRWGGEEFVLVFPRTTVTQAEHFMGRLRDALIARHPTAELPFQLAFSAGLADTRGIAGTGLEAVLKAVDKALYRAKRYRDRVEQVQPGDLPLAQVHSRSG
jgi:diguanylate cyclase (GGDEF)-like protein